MKRGKSAEQRPRASKRPRTTSTSSNKFLLERSSIIPELFSQWREFFVNDYFTDLRVMCKDDNIAGVTLHRAVLASCSLFLASLLSEDDQGRRDETTLLMPDIEKEDFLNLVKILYGERVSRRPSEQLLILLGIENLPPSPAMMPSAPTCKYSKCSLNQSSL